MQHSGYSLKLNFAVPCGKSHFVVQFSYTPHESTYCPPEKGRPTEKLIPEIQSALQRTRVSAVVPTETYRSSQHPVQVRSERGIKNPHFLLNTILWSTYHQTKGARLGSSNIILPFRALNKLKCGFVSSPDHRRAEIHRKMPSTFHLGSQWLLGGLSALCTGKCADATIHHPIHPPFNNPFCCWLALLRLSKAAWV